MMMMRRRGSLGIRRRRRYSRIPTGARTQLLFSSPDIKTSVQEELRAKLISMVSPKAPDTGTVEEELRTLPHVIMPPFDLERGPKCDMMSERVRARRPRRTPGPRRFGKRRYRRHPRRHHRRHHRRCFDARRRYRMWERLRG